MEIIPKIEKMIDDISLIPNTNKGKVITLSKFYKDVVVFKNKDKECLLHFTFYDDGGFANFFIYVHQIYDQGFSEYKLRAKSNILELNAGLLADYLFANKVDEDCEISLNLEKISQQDDELIMLIIETGFCDMIDLNIGFTREKLQSLREKYTNKQKELSELLFS